MNFNLSLAQKKGMASSDSIVNDYIGFLIGIILIAIIGSQIFSYTGSGSVGLGNSTINPDIPIWLPSTMTIIVAVGLIYAIMKIINKK